MLVYQLNFIRFAIIKFQMALRIGAILLASANLISGSLIGTGTVIESSLHHHGVTYYTGDTPEPLPVSGIVVNTHVTGDADMDCGSVGCSKGSSSIVVQSQSVGHAAVHGSHAHVATHGSHGSHVRVHASHSNSHSDADSSCSQSDAGSHHAHVSHGSHAHVHAQPNINKEFVDFKPIQNVDSDDVEYAKSHITTVTVPLISTVPTTQHKVSKNYNINRSNLPENQPTRNYRAKKNLLEYDNLLNTAVEPVKDVSVSLKSYSNKSFKKSSSPLKYKIVVPGNLEKKTFDQVVTGQVIENANPVVTNYVVAEKVRSHSHDHTHTHAYTTHTTQASSGRQNRWISHQTVASVSQGSLRHEVSVQVQSEKEAVVIDHTHKEEESNSDYNYWMGTRPGRLYADKAVYLGHKENSHSHSKAKASYSSYAKTTASPIIVQSYKVVQGNYGYHH